jgi:hypothetical protein
VWLAVVPVATLLLGPVLDLVRGPAWLGADYDPEYKYLLNAVNLLELAPPGHHHHPGTPLQAGGAVLIWLAHRLTGAPAGTARQDVFARPEFFLAVIAQALIVAQAVATGVLGWLGARLTGSVSWAVSAQLAPFLVLASVESLGRVTPEPALLVVGTVLAAVGLAALGRGAGDASGPPWPWLLGALVGLGVATKVTFAPALLVALALVEGTRARVRVAATALAVLALCLLPLVGRLPTVVAWFVGVAVHGGGYGTGPSTVVDVLRFPRAGFRLVAGEPLFFALWLVTLAVLLANRRRPGDGRHGPVDRAHRALAAVLVAELVQVGLAAKAGGVLRHLVPAAALAGLHLCLLGVLVGPSGRLPHRRRWSRGLAAALGLGLFFQAGLVAGLARELLRRQAAQRTIHAFGRTLPGSLVVPLYGAPSPALAFAIGNLYAGGRYDRELHASYAGTVLFAGPHLFDGWEVGPAGPAFLRSEGDTYLQLGAGPLSSAQIAPWARSGRLWFLGPRELLPAAFAYDADPSWPPPAGVRPRMPLTERVGVYRAGVRED